MTDLEKYMFALEMQVRDYELDYQGIVNNANYLHYLEHTRHAFCVKAGVSFAQLHELGIDPVLARIEADYKQPLRADDSFLSCLNLRRKGPKFIFEQDIYRSDGVLSLHALVTVVSLKDMQLSRGDELAAYFKNYLETEFEN